MFFDSIDGWAKLGQGAILSFKFEFESVMEDHVECGTGLKAKFTVDPVNGFVRLIMKSKIFKKF